MLGIGEKPTAEGMLTLDGAGTWDANGDTLCVRYGADSSCAHVIVRASSATWFDLDDEYFAVSALDPGDQAPPEHSMCGRLAPPRRPPPTALEIVGIRITSWPTTKPDGADWDASLIESYRRPDLRVFVTDLDAEPGVSNYRFSSSTFTNAHSQSHLFVEPTNDPTSSDNLNPRLPVIVPAAHRFRVRLLDEDIGGVTDDEVGQIIRIPAHIAENIDDLSGQQTLTFPDDDGHGVTFQVIANWLGGAGSSDDGSLEPLTDLKKRPRVRAVSVADTPHPRAHVPLKPERTRRRCCAGTACSERYLAPALGSTSC